MKPITDRQRLRQFDMPRLALFLVSVAAYLVTEFGRFVWRPYVREHGIDDFGLADSIGNLGGIVVQIFFTLAVVNPARRVRYGLVAFLVCGYILYEVLQPVLPRGVFDWNDVWATVIGGAFCIPLLLLFDRYEVRKRA